MKKAKINIDKGCYHGCMVIAVAIAAGLFFVLLSISLYIKELSW